MTKKSESSARDVLAATLKMGPVGLNVRDLKLMTQFYRDVIGLEVLTSEPEAIHLGFHGRAIVTLHRSTNLDMPFPGDAGLYHLAIVFASRGTLAKAVERVLHQTPHLFSGSADHLVSEAFYLSDPEGNGIELYYDRDPATWEWENGEVKMTSLYIHPQEYIHAYAPEKATDDSRHMGHVHLKVGSIEHARKFYVDTVGFTVTAALPSALFVSVNGYHHHLGMNSWESEVATARRETLGLRNFEILLPHQHDLAALRERLENSAITVQGNEKTITFFDPWKNQIIVSVPDA